MNLINQLTMSSREIAELTGKRHDHVMRDIRKMLKSLDVCEASSRGSYLDITGRSQLCFNLNIKLCATLVSGYSVTARAALVEKMGELAILEALDGLDFDDTDVDVYVYAIRESETGRIKIGISRDPEQRLKQLQIGNSQKLEIVATKLAANKFKDEKLAHIENRKHHIRSEWFESGAKIQ